MMARWRKRVTVMLLLAAATVIVALIYRQQFGDRPSTIIHADAPAFIQQAVDGREIRLADYRGRYVVLDFWATYCPPCEKEMPIIQRIAQKRDDLAVIGVNAGQSRGTVMAFVKSNQLSFPIVIDASGQVADEYQVKALPTKVLINPNGRVVKIATGAFNSEMQLAEWLDD